MNGVRGGSPVRRLISRLRSGTKDGAEVTVCVPTYMASPFIAETLQAISRQTYGNVRVLISLDPSDDGTDRACERFLEDPRFTLIRQATRLGWPGNVNFLLDQVRTDFFCIICHDDVIEPDYIRRLMRHLRRSSDVTCAYPVMKRFGSKPSAASIESIEGDAFARARQFFAQPLHAVPLRGVTRTRVLHRGLRLRELGTGGFLAEMLYVFELTFFGNCKRVGKAVYHSRHRPDSVSNAWRSWSDERKRSAWRHLLRAFCHAIRRQDFTAPQQIALLESALPWAFQLRGWLPAEPAEEAAISDPGRLSTLARAWAGDPGGWPPLL